MIYAFCYIFRVANEDVDHLLFSSDVTAIIRIIDGLSSLLLSIGSSHLEDAYFLKYYI